MSLVIYLGLDAFSREPNLLLPSGQLPLPLQTLQETKQKGTVLLEEMTESAAQLINQYLASNPEQSIQLLWPQPIPYIAALISQDTAPSELQNRWKVQAQRLVTLFRKHRKQLKLYGYVPGQQLSQEVGVLNQVPPLDASPLQRLASAYLLNEDAELHAAHSYLIASSQEASEWQQDATRDITDALIQQKTLETVKLENQQHAQKIDQVQSTLERRLNDLGESRKIAKEANDENLLVIKELHRVQEALEQALIKKEQLTIGQKEPEGLQTLLLWLRACAYRHATVAYRNSRAYKKSLPDQVSLIENSSYFNAQWYCEQYPDVAKSGMNPAEHYVKFGALEGRNPSEAFDTEYYLRQHKDVAASGQHPLLHYVKYGMEEKRETQPSLRQLHALQPKNRNAKERA